MFYPLAKALGWVADPADLSLLLLVGAVLVRRRSGISAALAMTAALVAGACSSPAVVDMLQGWVESAAPNTYRPEVHYDAARPPLRRAGPAPGPPGLRPMPGPSTERSTSSQR